MEIVFLEKGSLGNDLDLSYFSELGHVTFYELTKPEEVPERVKDADVVIINKMEINEGKNVTDVLASVSEGSNEVGIVYATDAASVADSVEVIAEAPEGSLKTPVLYPAGMVEDKEASDDDKAAAEAFLEYLQSDEALEVFEKYGFAAYVNDEKTDDTAAAEETAEPTEEASEDTAE